MQYVTDLASSPESDKETLRWAVQSVRDLGLQVTGIDLKSMQFTVQIPPLRR